MRFAGGMIRSEAALEMDLYEITLTISHGTAGERADTHEHSDVLKYIYKKKSVWTHSVRPEYIWHTFMRSDTCISLLW